jgi:hypothetical protein
MFLLVHIAIYLSSTWSTTTCPTSSSHFNLPPPRHNAWHEGSTASWGALPMAERIAWVTKIADALEAIQPQIGALESLDTGKPVALATAVDANRSVQNFRFFAKSVTPLPPC